MTPHSRHLIDVFYTIYKKYRHVAVKLETNWGTEECHHLFQRYLAKDRNQRAGFDPEIYSLLVSLYSIHENIYGDFDQPVVIMHPNINVAKMFNSPNGSCAQKN